MLRSRNLTPAGLSLALLLLAACGNGDPGTPYTPPATTDAGDGWSSYVEAPLVDKKNANGLDPVLDTPEGAVVKFLASRVRGDRVWRKAMVSNLSESAEGAIEEWNEWSLEKFQLRGRREVDPNRLWIRAYFEIKVGGSSDSGEDEFDVRRESDGWKIVQPPA